MNLKYNIKVRVFQGEPAFGPGVAELMERVERTGSLSEGCREMGMAYSKGWKIIRRAEKDLGFSLMTGNRGGSTGGSTVLTEEGKDFLRRFRSFEASIHEKAEELFKQF